jgi:hypothetical protein
MKEDLSLYGKELNYANAIWSAAYIFGQVPSNLLLTRVCIVMIPFSTQINKNRSTRLFILLFLNLPGLSLRLPPLVLRM